MAMSLRQCPFSAVRPTTSCRRGQVKCSAAKLYSNPMSRGRIIEWYLKEIGKEAEVEVVNMDMKEKREHKTEAFKQVNPFGKIPALEDDGLKLFESGAILLYLADKYNQMPDLKTRAAAYKWALFANSTMANGIFMEQLRERQMPEIMGGLDALLAKQPFVESSVFTICDVLVGAYLLYIPAFFPTMDLSPYPNVQAYMARLAERPACAATVAARAAERKAEETAPKQA